MNIDIFIPFVIGTKEYTQQPTRYQQLPYKYHHITLGN